MGYMKHEMLIADIGDAAGGADALSRLESWRAALPENWRKLVVGPVPSVVNNYQWVVFLPDGSKEGWKDSDLGDRYRDEFAAIMRPGTIWPLLHASWGDDEPAIESEDRR